MNKFNSDINPKNYYGEALELKFNDERLKEFQEQRLKRGFDESECWSIDYVIVSFALPRIKRLLEIEENIHGQINDEADGIIDFECEEYLKDLRQIVKDLENYDNSSTDLSLFFKRFKQLWCTNMKKYFNNLFKKLYSSLHLLIIPICCGIIIVFWTYLLFQQEVRNSLSLVYDDLIDVNTLIASLVGASIYFLFGKFKEFKQELFDKIEREHANTISYLQAKLTEQINYSTKSILLQEKKK